MAAHALDAAQLSKNGVSRALGLVFSARSTDPSASEALERLLAALAVEDLPSDPTAYEIQRPERMDTWTVYVDGQLIGESPTAQGAASLVLWDVNHRAIAMSPNDLLFHAAAVSHHGHGILLPGPSGTGKSTLAAGLVLRGMDYLSDEVAALDPVTLHCVAYPKPLSLAPSARAALAPLLGNERAFDEAPVAPWLVAPDALRPTSVGADCPVRLIVVHRYTPGRPTSLQVIRRSSALVALAQSSFRPLSCQPSALGRLADVVRGCRCVELTVGDLQSACDRLFDYLHED